MRTIDERRQTFRELHRSGCFAIPNPWDIGSARYLEHLGFKALATTSVGCAPMGTVENFASQLHESGFREVTTMRLIPVQPFFGVTASL
jgi:2-methylisocitrate lyase-like PEP mutase family enzyme